MLKNYVKAINGSIEEGATKDQAKLQIHEQESYDIHGGDELKYIYIYTINWNNIIERMCRSNTMRIIAGKETKAKLTSIGKKF